MTAEAFLSRRDLSDQGWFGRLIAGPLSLYTGELPWKENQSNISCVPPEPGGEDVTYWAKVTFSPRFGRGLYLLAPTHPRTGIRIHPANLMGDAGKGYRCQLNGCIALGERVGWLDGQKAVLLSAPAVRRLESFMGRRPFKLTIQAR